MPLITVFPPRISESETIPGKISDVDMPHLLLYYTIWQITILSSPSIWQLPPLLCIGEPFHIKDAGNDWLINWYLVREKGIVLFGPSPAMLIDPISKAEFMHAVYEQTIAWREWIKHTRLRRAQAYAILTMCRALYTLKKGEYPSKKQAALWAEKELPGWSSLISQALVWREDWRNVRVDHDETLPQTLQFVHFVLSQCEDTPGVSSFSSPL